MLALYLAFQKVRSPSALRHQEELNSKLATETLIAETTDSSARQVLDSGRFQVAKPEGVYVGQMGRLARKVAPHPFGRAWVLFQAPPSLVTYEEPVVLVPISGRARRVRQELRDAGVVLFPISPEAVLALFRNDPTRAHSKPQRPGSRQVR